MIFGTLQECFIRNTTAVNHLGPLSSSRNLRTAKIGGKQALKHGLVNSSKLSKLAHIREYQRSVTAACVSYRLRIGRNQGCHKCFLRGSP